MSATEICRNIARENPGKISVEDIEGETRGKLVAILRPFPRCVARLRNYLPVYGRDDTSRLAVWDKDLFSAIYRLKQYAAFVLEPAREFRELRTPELRDVRTIPREHHSRHICARTANSDNGLVTHEDVRSMGIPVHEEAICKRTFVLWFKPKRRRRNGGYQ